MNRSIVLLHQSKESGDPIQVPIYETFQAPPASHLWPSGYILHEHCQRNGSDRETDTVWLELGCGVGLPSLVRLATLPQSLSKKQPQQDRRPNLNHVVILSDSVPEALSLAQKSAMEIMSRQPNKVSDRIDVTAVNLKWGDFPSIDAFLANTPPITTILCADLFYERDSFDALIGTIATILSDSTLRQNNQCFVNPRCLVAYHERSSRRSIQHLLDKWGLEARSIGGNEFGYIDGRVGPSVVGLLGEGGGEGITVEGIDEGKEVGSGWGEGMHSVFMCSITLKSTF